ncbi:hypothetical protein GINT2_000162 [Glugoides intestinalis]
MTELISKEARDLLKEKESDVTWFKIFEFFERLIKVTTTQAASISILTAVSELLIRSLQSDRSRLNGVSLVFLKKCAELLKQDFCFNQFLPILIKLSGKTNKIFVSRAMDTLCTICKYIELKYLLKNIQDFVESPNKNIRVAIFTIIEIRMADAPDTFKPFIEKGIRDPAQEVRSICKPICAFRESKAIIPEKEIKKTVFKSLTPRKIPKIDNACAEIKKLEDAVKQIAKEEVIKKKIDADFFEKLNKLKKERKLETEAKNDDLTPRRLDKYLEKYRSSVNAEITSLLPAKVNMENINMEPCNSTPTSGSTGIVKVSDNILTMETHEVAIMTKENSSEEVIPLKNENNIEELSVISIENSDVFKNEVDAIEPQNDSVVHFIPENNASFMILNSDDHIDQAIEIIEEYECGLHSMPPLVDEAVITDLNRSFANISIEPSKIDSFQGIEDAQPVLNICFSESYNIEKLAFNNQTKKTELTDMTKNPQKDVKDLNNFHPVVSLQQNVSASCLIALIQNYETDNHKLGIPPANSNISLEHNPDSSPLIHTLSNNPEENSENASIEQMRSIELLEQEGCSLHIKKSAIAHQSIFASEIDTEKQNFAIESIGIDLEIHCSDISINFDDGLANDDISSFIEKLSNHQKNDPNATFYIKNDNNTIIIDSVHMKEPSNIFHGESNGKASCVDLFNEPIFCSDDEEFSKKTTPLLKDRPKFSIEITSDVCNDEHYAP